MKGTNVTFPGSKSVAGLILVALLVFAEGCAPTLSRSETFVMNTILTQTVYGSEEVCVRNEQIARSLEEELSRTIEGSDIWKINETADGVAVSADTSELVRISLEQYKATNGAFDPALGAFRDLWGFGTETPHVPTEEELQELLAEPGADAVVWEDATVSGGGANIDLGAAAKGYALDAMHAAMEEEDVGSALISFGGAILALGTKPDGEEWRVGIRDPFSENAADYVAVMQVKDTCVQTSGISEQNFVEDGTLYHHILDPQTGMPADTGLAAVVVVSPSGVLADIWSTALFVMGPERGLSFCSQNDIAALFITEDRQMLRSSAFGFELEDVEAGYTIV